MITEERLKKVEQELSAAKRYNCWLLLAGAGLALGLCAAIWVIVESDGTARVRAGGKDKLIWKEEKTIRANRFILEDTDGKPRAWLVVDEDELRLFLYDENEYTCARMILSEGMPELTLYRSFSHIADIVMGEFELTLMLYDWDENIFAYVEASRDKDLRVHDEKDKLIWSGPWRKP